MAADVKIKVSPENHQEGITVKRRGRKPLEPGERRRKAGVSLRPDQWEYLKRGNRKASSYIQQLIDQQMKAEE